MYHWDGPGQLGFLDSLLAIDDLDAIQWVPGDGNPMCEAEQWYPMYRRILEAGKGLILQCWSDRGAVREVLKKLPREGVLISTWAASEAEADELLKWASG